MLKNNNKKYMFMSKQLKYKIKTIKENLITRYRRIDKNKRQGKISNLLQINIKNFYPSNEVSMNSSTE